MHIHLTPEALLTQLDYPVTPQTLAQMQEAVANTPGFDHFSKHLLSLKDALSHYNSIIALSNSHPFLKIKCEENSSEETIEAFRSVVKNWREKYKVSLQKVDEKPTYYIIGQN
ncbi:MAG TPA: hypothetical protein ENL02_01690 [Epsilonproteobacteria bacterium]|nr:hypothetical protein [Campylobacterota bacterium]